ncbi:unnamed protein product, partial [Effrenium voratum]
VNFEPSIDLKPLESEDSRIPRQSSDAAEGKPRNSKGNLGAIAPWQHISAKKW